MYDGGIQYWHPELNDNHDPSRHVTDGGYTWDGAPLDIPARMGTALRLPG